MTVFYGIKLQNCGREEIENKKSRLWVVNGGKFCLCTKLLEDP